MEIERKWLVSGWPEGLAPAQIYQMAQGYLALRPTTVRIKGRGKLVREEIETPIDQALFSRLFLLIGLPLIQKERRDYPLPDGRTLEVNLVDAGTPTAFFYAEVEFESEADARTWSAADCGLAAYLTEEVTEKSGVSMGAYWQRTRYETT